MHPSNPGLAPNLDLDLDPDLDLDLDPNRFQILIPLPNAAKPQPKRM
jgi:hypothetical protein